MRRAAACRARLAHALRWPARQREPAAAATPSPGRLWILGDLIDDTLISLGARPVFAEALHGTSRPTTRTSYPAPGTNRDHAQRGGAGTDTGTSGTPGTMGDGDSASRTADPDATQMSEAGEEIADDHAETWRLVLAAQGGDGDAFGLLYDRYVDVVFRFVYFRINDRGLAEDFTSETFLRALRRIGSISYQGRDIGAWLITIARNIVLDHIKSARNRLEMTTGDTIEGKEHAQSTENAVLTTLQNEQLMAAVIKLGDEQRECVTLRFIHGLSVSETAEVMGKNDGAIKALQHRAVRKLADLVGGELR